MAANRQMGSAYLFFRSGARPRQVRNSLKGLGRFHPLVDLYLPGGTSLVRGDGGLIKVCRKLESLGFNQALKIIARDRPNFSALGESLVIIDCMIKRRILEEGNFAFITYKAKHKAKRKYRKLQIPLDPKHQ